MFCYGVFGRLPLDGCVLVSNPLSTAAVYCLLLPTAAVHCRILLSTTAVYCCLQLVSPTAYRVLTKRQTRIFYWLGHTRYHVRSGSTRSSHTMRPLSAGSLHTLSPTQRTCILVLVHLRLVLCILSLYSVVSTVQLEPQQF